MSALLPPQLPSAPERPDPPPLGRIQARLRVGLVSALFGVGLMSADAISAIATQGQTWLSAAQPPERSPQVQQWIEVSRQAGQNPEETTAIASASAPSPQAAAAQPVQPLRRPFLQLFGGGASARQAGGGGGSSWHQGSFPVENFQSYTSGFGYRRGATGGSRWEFHRGLDLAAPKGSYIRNWWAGRVVKVASDNLCGTSVTIQSGRWQHVYCHMEGSVATENGRRYLNDREGGIRLWEGQDVGTGGRIGRVGMTGRTTGPHLHWGVKYGDDWIDPGLILRAMYEQQGS